MGRSALILALVAATVVCCTGLPLQQGLALLRAAVGRYPDLRDTIDITYNTSDAIVTVHEEITMQRHPSQLLLDLGGTPSDGVGSFEDPVPDDIVYEFYTSSSSSSTYHRLVAEDATTVTSSSFDPKLLTVVIVHGFIENADTSPWMATIKQHFHDQMRCNIIMVQWNKLGDANLFLYPMAVRNAAFVGNNLGDLFKTMQHSSGLRGDRLYLIGFSLGAHVCGFAGKTFPNIKRITGLDPAGPGYDYKTPKNRLAKTDADFVDIIHTFTNLLGYKVAMGHVDFFVNGGAFQPGCVVDPGCSHYRAHDVYIASLHKKVLGYQCPTYQQFEAGKCFDRPWNYFGIQARADRPGVYYMDTLANGSLLADHYSAEITIGQSQSTVPGSLVVVDGVDVNHNWNFLPANKVFKAGDVLNHVLLAPSGVSLDQSQLYVYYMTTYDGTHNITLESVVAVDPEQYSRRFYACDLVLRPSYITRHMTPIAFSAVPCQDRGLW